MISSTGHSLKDTSQHFNIIHIGPQSGIDRKMGMEERNFCEDQTDCKFESS